MFDLWSNINEITPKVAIEYIKTSEGLSMKITFVGGIRTKAKYIKDYNRVTKARENSRGRVFWAEMFV